MKIWNYTRALRWLAIEPGKRRIENLGYPVAKWDLGGLVNEGVSTLCFIPPTDPVPLAEVLYELVSGEEEEFRIDGDDAYTKISWDSEMQCFEIYQEDVSCWTRVGSFITPETGATFHRIAEKKEEKREPMEYFAIVHKTVPEPTSLLRSEKDCWRIAKATLGSREQCERDGWRVIKFREVVE